MVAARHRARRVAELVEPYTGESDVWRERLRTLIQWSLSPGLVDLAVRLLDRGDLDGLRGPIAVNASFFSVLYGLHKQDPAGTARIIGAYIRRGQARAAADGSNDPFTSGHLPTHGVSGDEIILNVAREAPASFLDAALPFVINIIEATAVPYRDSTLRGSPRWGVRFAGPHVGIDDALFAGLEHALQTLAASSPDAALVHARELAVTDIKELRFLACRTFTATDAADESLRWLLSDDQNLSLGWANRYAGATRDLIETTTTTCSTEQLRALTRRLLDFYPPHELRAENENMRGEVQYELLTAVPSARRDEDVTRRIGELRSRFGVTRTTAPAPSFMRMAVSSVNDEAVRQMSDDELLETIINSGATEVSWNEEGSVGGALELANQLAQLAAGDPGRYTRIALRLPAGTPAIYFTYIIQAVSSRIATAELSDLCQHAYDVAGEDVLQAVSFAIPRQNDLTEPLLSLLEHAAAANSPDQEFARTEARPGEYFFGGDLASAGLNSTRGSAARAIADVLYRHPEHTERLLPQISSLAADPILAIRTQAANAVRVLISRGVESAYGLADILLTGFENDLLSAIDVMAMLSAALHREPERFAPYLMRALDGPEEVAENAGQAWAAAYLRGSLPETLPASVAELSVAGRRGAARILAQNPIHAAAPLQRLFDDAEAEIRDAAASALRFPHAVEPLLEPFVNSLAFAENFGIALSTLEESTQVLPEGALEVCERATDVAGRNLGDIRTAHAAVAGPLISVVLRLYRPGNEATRRRCLDVIDKLSEAGAFGLDQKLDEMR